MPAHRCPHCGAPNLSRLAPCRSCGTDPVRTRTASPPASAAEETTQPVVAVAQPSVEVDARLSRMASWQRLTIELAGVVTLWMLVPDQVVASYAAAISLALMTALFLASVGLTAAQSGVGAAAILFGLGAAVWAMYDAAAFQWVALVAPLFANILVMKAFRQVGVSMGLLGPKASCSNVRPPSRRRFYADWALAAAVVAMIPATFAWRTVLLREDRLSEPFAVKGMTLDKPKSWSVKRNTDETMFLAADRSCLLSLRARDAAAIQALAADFGQQNDQFRCGRAEVVHANGQRWTQAACTFLNLDQPMRATFLIAEKSDGSGAVMMAMNAQSAPEADLDRAIATARTLRFEPTRSASAAP